MKKDQTEKLKKKLNSLITTLNGLKNNCNINKLIRHYRPGYIYGNSKIHKNTKDPPIYPIISQIGTPTYKIAKSLNKIIVQYMPKRHMVESTYEMLNILRTMTEKKIMTSLDTDNLFPNVSVNTTINIILESVYENENMKPLDMPRNIIKQL